MLYFNIIHPVALGILIAFYNAVVARWDVEHNYQKISLEKIFLGAVVSGSWIVVGIYRNMNDYILLLEGFAVCFALIGLVSKLNMPGRHTFFGRLVPGHGGPEKGIVLIMKRVLFSIVATATIAALLMGLAMALGPLLFD